MMEHSLSLHMSIYDLEHILRAVDAFRALACVHVQTEAEYYICSFTKCVHDPSVTQKEFENYIIDLMNIHHDT